MSDLTPVTAYADKRGVLHRTELEVYNANDEYDKEEYIYSICRYSTDINIYFLNLLSIHTLRMMCIDLRLIIGD